MLQDFQVCFAIEKEILFKGIKGRGNGGSSRGGQYDKDVAWAVDQFWPRD